MTDIFKGLDYVTDFSIPLSKINFYDIICISVTPIALDMLHILYLPSMCNVILTFLSHNTDCNPVILGR